LTPLTLIAQSHKTKTPTKGFFTRWPQPAATPSLTPTPGASIKPIKGLPKLISGVKLRFSASEQPQWAWSTKLAGWVRSEFSTPSFAKSGVRLSAKNVVIIRTKTADAGYRDPAGNFVPRTILVGTGAGYVMSGHEMRPITWSKTDLHSQMTIKNLQGKVISLLPGNTWVELVPLDGGQVNFVYPKATTKK
jgi:hypothetical protein